MASYLNGSAPPGNLLVLPHDDFYQMPYTWGYYGVDTFIINLIARNVVDPIAQGYAPAGHELGGAVRLVQQGLLAHDWKSVHRVLDAMGTPLLLVRGDVNAAFPKRHITPPVELERALRKDPGIRLVRRFGKLELFELRAPTDPTGFVTSYATVNSAEPDLRDLSLFSAGPLDLKLDAAGRSRGAAGPACCTMAVDWRPTRNSCRRATRSAVPRQILSATGAYKWPVPPSPDDGPGLTSAARTTATRPSARARLITRTTHLGGHAVKEFSYKLGRSLLRDGDFASGRWAAVGNCAAFPGTTATARLSARVLPGHGPTGQPALELAAHADSACEARQLSWRSGPLFVSLWVRNVSGAAPRICLWQLPVYACAAVPPLPAERNPLPVVPLPGDCDAFSRDPHYRALPLRRREHTAERYHQRVLRCRGPALRDPFSSPS